MPYLLLYLIKLSLTLAVLYAFYAILLKNLTFYTWNRFYLLFYSLASFFIPFINITPWIAEQPAGPEVTGQVNFVSRLPTIAAIADHPASFSAWQLLCALFAAGLLAMLARLAAQLLSIRSIRRSATLISAGGIYLYDVDSPISPFSFAQSIFVNTRLHSTEELQKIVEHEFVHVRQKHTVDLLAAELLCIINWFNPFAWLIKRAIKQNLEFIADNSVLQSGFDARHYQYLLLKVTGLQPYSISSNFNISSLKKRIIMMNKMRSARVHLLKFLFVLPLLALILVSFRGQLGTKQLAASVLQKNGSIAYDTVPPPPPPPPPMPPAVSGKQHKPAPPPPAPPVLPKGISNINVGFKATVTLKNGKKEVYDLDDPSKVAAFEKKYGPLPPPPPPAMVHGVDMRSSKNGNDSLMNSGEKAADVKEKAEWEAEKTANEKEQAEWKAEKVVWENERAANEKQKAIWEKQKAANKNKYGKALSPSPELMEVHPDTVVVGHKKITGTKMRDLLYVVDGVLLPGPAALRIIDGQPVKRVEVLEDEKATSIYGDKGANGVVMITTKSTGAAAVLDESERKMIDFLNKGLIIIDGKEATKSDVLKMLGHPPKSISTYSADQAVKKYGDKAKNGVLILASNGNSSSYIK